MVRNFFLLILFLCTQLLLAQISQTMTNRSKNDDKQESLDMKQSKSINPEVSSTPDSGTVIPNLTSSPVNPPINSTSTNPNLISQILTSSTPKPSISLQTSLVGHALPVTIIAITNNNKIAVSGSEDNTVKVWDIQTGQQKFNLTGHIDVVQYLKIINDKYIISSDNKSIIIWDLQTGKLLSNITNANRNIKFIEVSQDGKTLIYDGGEQKQEPKPYPRDDYNNNLVSTKYAINLVSLPSGILKQQIISERQNNIIAQSKLNQYIIAGDELGNLSIYDIKKGTLISSHKTQTYEIKELEISPDEKTFVSSSRDGKIQIWDLPAGILRATFTGHKLEYRDFPKILIPNNQTLVTSSEKDIKIWDIHNGQLKHTIAANSNSDSYSYMSFKYITITPDNKDLITNDSGNKISIWSLETGMLKNHFTNSDTLLGFSSDKKLLATHSQENKNTINIWQVIPI